MLSLVNNRILPLFGIRIERVSNFKAREQERQRLETLAASSNARQRIIKLAKLLKPHSAIGQSKVRIGRKNDGGYVCLDDFKGIKGAFSFGIFNDVSWDSEIADRGIIVYQFDHTVDGPPTANPNFRFEKKRIVASGGNTPTSTTISSLLTQLGDVAPSSLILKIDIEHEEWEVFEKVSDEELSKFSQIICEFHSFSRVIEDSWFARAKNALEKLHRRFEVVHVHANNYAPLISIGNIPFCETLEVTYGSRDRYTFGPLGQPLPTNVDAPNDPDRPDIYLGYFEFDGG
ncbi:hypothetical protein [Bradyrhizobium sp. NP1]|uniref:hypothetical protein n=1 Tax=Bradyrhizobium sp. NP1 TaxID=3049772 RepID=UPI0025A64F65|nr:hypothetical protein [Bradyrhizobium sp. NP1]WJR76376.1 hypothetical protein QOU61_26940 [Bradyrhizobium sp. NP1]